MNRRVQSPVSVFAVVGYKKTGKTTLVCKLVSEFKQRGLRVGTVKHDVHQFQMDYPGTDTYKHREAGADAVAIASGSRWVLQAWPEEPVPLADLLAAMRDVDVIIVEGYKQEHLPKIVIADVQGAIFTQEALTNVAAVVVNGETASLAPSGVDVYDKNDVAAIADHMLQILNRK
jgi:molybdopterin-guanine dinucleotide biosynthesis protein B